MTALVRTGDVLKIFLEADHLDALSFSTRQPIKTKRAVVAIVFVPGFYS